MRAHLTQEYLRQPDNSKAGPNNQDQVAAEKKEELSVMEVAIRR